MYRMMTLLVTPVFRSIVRLLAGRGGRPKCRNFKDFVLKVQMGQSETAAHETAVAEEPLDLAWGGIRRNIKILRCPLEKQVTDTAPDKVGNEAVVTEPVECPQRIGTYPLSGYAVFFPGNDEWLHGFLHITPLRKSKIPGRFFSDKSIFDLHAFTVVT